MNHKKLNVLILGPYLNERGGVSNFTKLLLNELIRFDYNIKYFPTGKRGFFLYNIFLPLYLLVDIVHFMIAVLLFNPDIIHINPSLRRKSMLRDSIYLYFTKMLRRKVLLFIHGWDEEIYKYFGKNNRLIKCWLKKIFLSVDKIIVLAKIFKHQLIQFGIESSKIEVLSIMIEYSKYAESKIKNNSSKINILFLANFFRDKGVYEIIKTIPLVLDQLPNRTVKFILAGDGPEIYSAKKLTKQLNIVDYVDFTGYVTGKKKFTLFRQSDLFICPTSHGEGFPTVIAEAMAIGLPIISTGVGAISEVIENNVNGTILSRPDENELANAIIKLIDNPQLMKKMGRNNQEKAKNYDVSVVCNRIARIYDSIGSA